AKEKPLRTDLLLEGSFHRSHALRNERARFELNDAHVIRLRVRRCSECLRVASFDRPVVPWLHGYGDTWRDDSIEARLFVDARTSVEAEPTCWQPRLLCVGAEQRVIAMNHSLARLKRPTGVEVVKIDLFSHLAESTIKAKRRNEALV